MSDTATKSWNDATTDASVETQLPTTPDVVRNTALKGYSSGAFQTAEQDTTDCFSTMSEKDNWQAEEVLLSGTFQRSIPNIPERVRSRVRSSFALQEWDGYVECIDDDTFTAVLVDLSTRDSLNTEERVTLPIAEISNADRSHLYEGAIFRWSIGYVTQSSGSKERTSRIVFRNLPAWTESELRNAQAEAERLASVIEWQ